MTELAREYGEGLYELAVEEKLAEVILDQLRILDASFRAEPDFCRLLSNRALGKEERIAILDASLGGQVTTYLLNFLKLLCERGLMQEFSGCVQVYTAHYNLDNNITVAQVTTSAPLTDDQRARLIDKLKTMTGKGVALEEKVDPAVMGGVLLEMDGQRWDNTVRNRLESIRHILTER